MKANDFIVASLTNPDYDAGMFSAVGLTAENTLMLSKDEYLKSNFIKNNKAFLDDEGKFSQKKFDEFYNNKLLEWNTFTSTESAFSYDLFDYRRFLDSKGKVKNPGLNIRQVFNPEESTIGDGLINKTYKSPLSDRERALKNKIFDSASGKWLEYSPNDHSLLSSPVEWFKDILRDPLVLATYDEDTDEVNPITGLMEHHKKGDKKVNEDGHYYYETLNGRSLADKQVLSGWDTLTVDGSALNKYDIFDSDDREKTIRGIIAKNALAIAPLFIGGPIGTIYGGVMVAKELMKSLPMIDGIFAAVTNNNTPFTRLANNIAAKGMAASQGMSDYGQENMFRAESLANTLTDVALLWQQQKTIAQAILKLSGATKMEEAATASAKAMYDKSAPLFKQQALEDINKLKLLGKMEEAAKMEEATRKAILTAAQWKESEMGAAFLNNQMLKIAPKIQEINRLGADISLLYMAMVSNTDVYQDMLDRGLSKREALAITLGSTAGMLFADTKLHLGETFFGELTSDGERNIRAGLKTLSTEWRDRMSALAKQAESEGSRNKIASLYSEAIKMGKSILGKYADDVKHHSSNFLKNSITEGLEEVSEELASDISKLIYELAASFKPTSQFFNDLSTDNVGAFDDFTSDPEHALPKILERYSGNFLGGFLGGGLFYGVEQTQGKTWRSDPENLKLILLLRDNRKSEVLKVLKEFKDSGKLGNKNLGIKYQENSNGKPIFLSTDNDSISQNDFIYNQLLYEIEGVDKIISDYNLKMSDGQLYDKMTLGEMRFLQLKEMLAGSDYQEGYIKRYDKLVQDIIDIESRIGEKKEELSKIQDSNRLEKEFKLLEILKLLEIKLNVLLALEDFKSGENAIDYMGRMLFSMDTTLNKDWYTANKESWLKIEKHMTLDEYNQLSDYGKEYIDEEYKKYIDKQKQYDEEKAWSHFKFFGERLQPELEAIQGDIKRYEDYEKAMSDLLDPKKNPLTNIKEVTASDITEDNLDNDLKVDYDSKYINEDGSVESDESYNNRNKITNPDGTIEDDESYLTRRNERLNKLKALKARETNRKRNLEALVKVRDIIQNSGGLLDPSTKRHLLLNMTVMLKDIIDDMNRTKFKLHTLYPSLSKEINESMSKIRSLRDLRLAKDEVSEMVKNLVSGDLKQELKNKLARIQKLKKAFGLDEDLLYIKFSDIQDYLTLFINFSKNNSLIFLTLNYVNGKTINLDKLNLDFNDFVTNNGLSGNSLLDNLKAFFVNAGVEESTASQLSNVSSIDQLLKYKIGLLDVNDKIDRELLLKQEFKLDLDTINLLNSLTAGTFNVSEIESELNSITTTDENGNDTTETLQDSFIKIDEIETVDEDGNPEIIKNYSIDESLVDSSITLKNKRNKTQDRINLRFAAFENSVRGDSIYSTIETIISARPVENPISRIVKKLALTLNRDASSIEEVLDMLMDLMGKDKKDNFVLTPQQRDLLFEARDLLKLARSFLYSTWNSSDLNNPYPHNLFINEVIERNHLKLNPFPVIDDSIAKLYNQLINNLIYEIGEEENGSYTPGSWLYWDSINAVNKSRMFLRADEKFNQAKLNFFERHKTEFKGSINEVNIDLLEGYDTLSFAGDGFKDCYDLECLIYNNIKKALADTNKSLNEILQVLPISNTLRRNLDDLTNQNTCELNDLLEAGLFTPMDIGMYIACLSTLDPTKYWNFIKENKNEHPDKAPLGILMYDSRLAMAYSENSKQFMEAIAWVQSLGNYEKGEIPLFHGIFISGNGGAGKSQVILRNTYDYLIKKLGKSKDKIRLCGPTTTQKNDLIKITDSPEICGKLPEELVNEILDATTLTKLKGATGPIPNVAELKKDAYGDDLIVCSNDIVFKNIDLDAIIIDESTHLDTLTLSILSTYCKQKNIPFVLLGDNYQQGALKGNDAYNLNQENCFIARTPRLAITLRDSNYQKSVNNNLMASLIRQFDRVPENASRMTLIQKALNDLNQLTLFNYNKAEINGDLIVSSINEEITSKLKKLIKGLNNENITPKIGYVGPKDETFNFLKNLLGNLLIDEPLTETNIQGLEFDHVIINVNWNPRLLEGAPNLEVKHSRVLTFLKRLYTLSTRGKTSAVFIDNGLLSLVKTETLDYLNTITNFDDKAKLMFNEYLDNNLSKIPNIPTSSAPSTNNSAGSTTSTPPPAPSVTGHASEGFDDTLLEDMFNLMEEDLNLFENPTLNGLVNESNNPILFKSPEELDNVNLGLAYGENTMLGIPQERDENGRWIWTPDSDHFENSDTLNDIEIFLDNSNPISDGREKFKLVLKLMALKSAILYNSTLITPDGNYTSKADRIFRDGIINLDDYIDPLDLANAIEQRRFKLVVSKADKNRHTFVGENGLLFSKSQIGEDELVFRIILDIPLKNGKVGRITLGLISSPERYRSNRPIIESITDNKISKLKALRDEEIALDSEDNKDIIQDYENRIIKLQLYRDNLPVYIDTYAENIRKASAKWKDANPHWKPGDVDTEVEINVKNVLFDGNTVIRTVQNSTWGTDDIEPIQKMRLARFDEDSTIADFEYKNPFLVVSPVYIYRATKSDSDILKSIRGRAVMFVSRDIGLNLDELIHRWISERGSGKHSVRMIKLDNSGVTMSDLCNDAYEEEFTTYTKVLEDGKKLKGSYNRFPMEVRELGKRLYVALHNFRATLLNFKAFVSQLNYTASELDAILQGLHEEYENYLETTSSPSEDGFRNWFRNKSNKLIRIEDAEEIWDFNDSADESGIRLFRLGTGNDNHWLIRDLNINPKTSKVYKNVTSDRINGIYIDATGLEQLSNCIDAIFSTIEPLGIRIREYSLDESGKETASREFLDTDYISNSSDGRLHKIVQQASGTNGRSNNWAFDDNAVAQGDLLRMLPSILTKLNTRCMALNHTVLKDGKLVLPAVENEEGKKSTERDWDWNWVLKIVIKEHSKDAEGNPIIALKLELPAVTEDSLFAKNADVFPKVLDLIFHGTSNTKGLIDKKLYGLLRVDPDTGKKEWHSKKEPLAWDAIFKDGFFIDPQATIGGWNETNGIKAFEGMFAPCLTSRSLFLVRAAIDQPRFQFEFDFDKIESTTSPLTSETKKSEVTTVSDEEVFTRKNVVELVQLLRKESDFSKYPLLVKLINERLEKDISKDDIDEIRQEGDNITIITLEDGSLTFNPKTFTFVGQTKPIKLSNETLSLGNSEIKDLLDIIDKKDLGITMEAKNYLKTALSSSKIKDVLREIKTKEDLIESLSDIDSPNTLGRIIDDIFWGDDFYNMLNGDEKQIDELSELFRLTILPQYCNI